MGLGKRISPTALVILDGFGYTPDKHGNAIAQAHMPTLTMLQNNYPWTLLDASGKQVGLLPGYAGNSEVGHLTLGAGRVIPSNLATIHHAIDDRSFFNNNVLQVLFTQIKEKNRALHIMGLLSDGGVHSHERHAHALLQAAHQAGIHTVFIHAFLDGRDTLPQSADVYLERLEQLCRKLGTGQIASLHGRFYAMDRDHNQKRTNLSFEVLTQQQAASPQSWQQALKTSYKNNISDEFFYPQQLIPNGYIKPGDGIIFFNFRPDRARQLSDIFLHQQLFQGSFITMTRYQKEFTNDVLFEQEPINHTLLDEIVAQKPQEKLYVIAETEKYAHVTYFFRGMREEKFPHETQILIPSLKEKDYSNHPEMSAQAITDAVITSVTQDPAYFYLINYANADMIGHSGNFQATIKACECLDKQLEQLYQKIVVELSGTIFITSDHGNAETKINQEGKSLTAHSTNPVIFIQIGPSFKNKIIFSTTNTQSVGLATVAPTILRFLNLTVPQEMA